MITKIPTLRTLIALVTFAHFVAAENSKAQSPLSDLRKATAQELNENNDAEAEHITKDRLDSAVPDDLPEIIRTVADYDCDWGDLMYLLNNPLNKMLIDVPDKDGWTALMWSIKKERPTFTQALLKAGANPNLYSKDGRSPLHWAAYLNAHNCAMFLVQDPRTEINYRGTSVFSSALIVAVEKKHRSIVELLVKYGADPYLPDYNGREAMDLADPALQKNILEWMKDAPQLPVVGLAELEFAIGLTLCFTLLLLLWFGRRCGVYRCRGSAARPDVDAYSPVKQNTLDEGTGKPARPSGTVSG